MRPFPFQRKIPCFPFWLACRSGYAFGVQHVQCISNYWHSWLASKSAVLKKYEVQTWFSLLFWVLLLLFLLLLWNTICSFLFFIFIFYDIILSLWAYFSFAQSICSSLPSDVSGRQLAVFCKETMLSPTAWTSASPEDSKYNFRAHLKQY